MSDDMLIHYNRELLHIRRAAAAFAAENPRIAGRLRLSEDAVEDRWAIAAYIRVLQLSQHAELAAIAEQDREQLKSVRAP